MTTPDTPRDGALGAKGSFRSRGLKIPNDPRLLSGQRRRALRTNTYEDKECDAVLRLVKRGDRVLELGAGLGYVSALIASKRRVARILCYEANPSLIPYIARLHAANNVTCAEVRNAVLAPEAGRHAFYERANFLSSSLEGTTAPEDITATHEIAAHAVGDILRAENPDVLVCDIEGAEATLLPAADWSCLRAAVIEIHPKNIGSAGVRAVFDAMHGAGLAYFPRASAGKVVAFRRDA